MKSLIRKELNKFFGSIIGYVIILVFLVCCSIFLFIFPDSSLLNTGYVSLDNFFDLAPWLFLFLVPAAAMNSFADEYKAGTFELLETKPLQQYEIVLGKFFPIVIIVIIALLPTIIYALTLNHFKVDKGLDFGATLGSYIGLIFLAAVFAAISVCCSAFTKNNIVAFIVGALLCLILYYGFNTISKIPFFVGNLDYFIEMLGIDYHYQSISRGVIDTKDLMYFISVMAVFLYITIFKIAKR